MKKIILILALSFIFFSANAQFYILRYDSVRVVSPLKLGTVTTGLIGDSLLTKKGNGRVHKIASSLFQPTITAGTTSQFYRGDKTFQTLDKTAVGLANVDNTTDVNKPISTANQIALNLKLSKAGDDITGDIGNTSTGFFRIPSGTTAQRPVTLLDGMRRYNTTTLRDEFYANGLWQNHARLSGDTFTGTVTAPTFSGGLTGNASTATTLATTRTIWGQNFNGSANVTGNLTGVEDITSTGIFTMSSATLNGGLGLTVSNVASDRKMTFNRTGGNQYSFEHDLNQFYLYNMTTGRIAFKVANSDAITTLGSLTIAGALTGVTSITTSGSNTLSALTASRVVTTDASKILTSSAVTTTELGYVSGVSSPIQTQLTAKANANGVSVQLADFYADATNTGITETDLFSYTTLANRLTTNGDKITATFTGLFSDATASSQLRVYFGGTQIGDTGALTMSVTGSFVVNVIMIKTGATTARTTVNVSTPGASTASYTNYTSLTGLTLTGTNIIKITGQAGGIGGGSGDITTTMGNIVFQPAAL